MARANDARERCRNDWWDNSQTFEGYERPWGLDSYLKSVEICLLKTRCRSIYGVAVFAVCWDRSVVSRFRLELSRNRWVGGATLIWSVVLLVKKTGADITSQIQELSAGWASNQVAGGKESKLSIHDVIYRSFCDNDEFSPKGLSACESCFTRIKIVLGVIGA